MYTGLKWMKIKQWILRNIFFYNREIMSLHGQCHFCEGEYFKKEDALEVEHWSMPATNFEALKINNSKELTEGEKAKALEKVKTNERTHFHFEKHKCKECGQYWTSNRISSNEIHYSQFD